MSASTQPRKPSLRKRLIIVIGAVVVLFVLVIGFNTFKGIMIGKFMASMSNPPQTVSAMKAEYQTWQPHVEAFGNVRAMHGVDLSFELAGLVESVDVKSGADVQKGQVLMKLVDAQDRAQLAALQAAERLAELTAQRSKAQLAVQAISKAQYDTDMANLKSAQANAAAQAALVAKKTLRAPFSGRVGIITVNPGQYINHGMTVATLQQSSLDKLRVGGRVEVTADAYAGKVFAGTVSATDPKVNTDTRNLGVEATLPNPDKLLVPGMFTKVAVDSGSVQRYLTLPQTAVTYAPYGDTVFVVHDGQPPAHDADGKPVPSKQQPAADPPGGHGKPEPSHYVEQVVVTVGPRRGDQVAILSGIKEGDLVVTSGQLKLKNGTPVNINNSVQPAFDPNPHPVEQ